MESLPCEAEGLFLQSKLRYDREETKLLAQWKVFHFACFQRRLT